MKIRTSLNLAMLTIILFSCNSSSSRKNENRITYQETKMTLEEQEKQNPVSFLSVKGTYRKNVWGMWVIEGSISNNASIATYKDVTLKIHFYTKTETLLGSEEHTIYEYFTPGQPKEFKIKTLGYKNTGIIGWNIIRASNAN